jgi:hypothetical protein
MHSPSENPILHYLSSDFAFKKERLEWFLVTACIWVVGDLIVAFLVYSHEAAQLAQRTGLDHWWHNNDPTGACIRVIFIGIVGLAPVFGVAHLLAVKEIDRRRRAALELQNLQEEGERIASEIKMLGMEMESATQASLAKAAQTKQELIMRLGSIDQYVRVLTTETDASKRTVALQAAQSEMTTLAAKVASDHTFLYMVLHTDIKVLAAETSSDLVRLGLSEDRLNRDIIRMFRLNGNGIG